MDFVGFRIFGSIAVGNGYITKATINISSLDQRMDVNECQRITHSGDVGFGWVARVETPFHELPGSCPY